jgi:nucleotidyltransferase substrate binding protein (TIGR01987 family)
VTDIRWKQRFQNFEKAWLEFKASLDDPRFAEFSVRERQGVIQQFEITLELAWKTLKDYLQFGGVDINPVVPKVVLREAFAAKIISGGEVWAEMIDLRNQLSHTYSQEAFDEALTVFKTKFEQPLDALYRALKSKVAL